MSHSPDMSCRNLRSARTFITTGNADKSSYFNPILRVLSSKFLEFIFQFLPGFLASLVSLVLSNKGRGPWVSVWVGRVLSIS